MWMSDFYQGVTPAQAGVQVLPKVLDSRFHGNDSQWLQIYVERM